jgi:hypothetical protein
MGGGGPGKLTSTEVQRPLNAEEMVLRKAGEEKNGAPGRSRTSDLLVRSQLLYPAELRAHIAWDATL